MHFFFNGCHFVVGFHAISVVRDEVSCRLFTGAPTIGDTIGIKGILPLVVAVLMCFSLGWFVKWRSITLSRLHDPC